MQTSISQTLEGEAGLPRMRETKRTSPKSVSPQGVSPQGVSPQGLWPQGVWPQGVWPQGVWPQGVWPQGVWPQGVWPQGVWPQGVEEDKRWKDTSSCRNSSSSVRRSGPRVGALETGKETTRNPQASEKHQQPPEAPAPSQKSDSHQQAQPSTTGEFRVWPDIPPTWELERDARGHSET